ncbi:MAG: 3-hydroxyacyl-CoA dehydrogenase [Bacteroidetes bacterium]|nr:MAG: 3-hydroxyacyl-CoA dehydrogenase [Bacteroidota bacterium]
MNIALTGSASKIAELRAKLNATCNIKEFQFGQDIPNADLLVDLDFDNHPDRIMAYAHLNMPLLLSAVKVELISVLAHFGIEKKDVFGLNALPGFINRELSECSAAYDAEKAAFTAKLDAIGLKPEWVQDRVGMVSPRILFMIINEAYYTVQEGTAGKADIDTGMKLGTAYPHGPFEWVDMIGIQEVFEVLDALYLDTRDERYKICSLLKKEAAAARITAH